jgi:hypothetical protein
VSQVGFDLDSSLVQGRERRVSSFEQEAAGLHRFSELLGFGQKLLAKGLSPVSPKSGTIGLQSIVTLFWKRPAVGGRGL